jgi:SAM-dependent methyltransferase
MQSTPTKQLGKWQGDLGRQYTDRNTITPEQLNALWMKNYGVSRSAVNRDFLGALPKDIHILEVGCNIGNQLLLLQELGFSNLFGLEIQDYALELARRQARGIQFSQGSAFNLPFEETLIWSSPLASLIPHCSSRSADRAQPDPSLRKALYFRLRILCHHRHPGTVERAR